MTTVQESIAVDVPLDTAYHQWTQSEDFPSFREGVEEVRRIDDRHNHWRIRSNGGTREFDTEIIDQAVDDHVAWCTVAGHVYEAGAVSFYRIDPTHTRVMLAIDRVPEDNTETTTDLSGMLDLRVRGDLRRFKRFVEHRGDPGTGG
ncbi:SRPBCC family protein [Kitasatospora camelliae]|uniref:SRPBCC family protein n=1 Tax=Kitasatospora camelliae TaxID=3156397 RepID=A0AAU8JSC6_9ACTN